MKKLLTLITVAIMGTCMYAQQELSFKIDYKPNSTYVINMDMDMDMLIKNLGGDADAEPFNQEMDMAFVYTIKTAAAKGTTVPFTAQISMDSPLLGAVSDKMSDIKFYGKIVNSVPQVDSIHAPGLDKVTVDTAMKPAMANMLSQFPVLDKKLKVGDSFNANKIPLNLGGGLNLGDKFNPVITYTLKKIEGKKGYFDMAMNTPIDMDASGMAMKGTMKFTGQMVYDSAIQYTESQTMDLDASFDVGKDDMHMNMSMTGTNKITTKITPN